MNRLWHWFTTCGLRPRTFGDGPETFVEERHPDCIVMASGRLFNIARPDSEAVNVGEIAHHLAQINRFGGACRQPYSVAQHSTLCAEECLRRYPSRRDLALACLLHDASEAYCGDVVRAVKILIRHCYMPIEERVQAAIWRKFGIVIDAETSQVVKQIDLAALKREALDLVPGAANWEWYDIEAAPQRITPMDWRSARDRFLDMFFALDAYSFDGSDEVTPRRKPRSKATGRRSGRTKTKQLAAV